MDILSQAIYFIGYIGSIVGSLIQDNYIYTFLIMIVTIICTLKIIKKLRYRESGG